MADVLFVLLRGTTAEVYGGERSTMTTAEALREHGHDARFLITAHDQLAEELRDRGHEFDVVSVGNPFIGFRGSGLAAQVRRLADIARLNAAVFRRSRRRSIVHTAQLNGLLAVLLGGKLAGARVVFHVRCSNGRPRTRLLELLGMLVADRTVTVSHSLRDEILAGSPPAIAGLLARRIVPIYNGFDFEEMDRVVAGRGPHDGFRLLLVGGIDRDKGQLAFLDRAMPSIVAAVPDARLWIVGGVEDEAYARACHETIGRHGLRDHVVFTGYLPRHEVYAQYRDADALVLPSWREGLPRAAIEAGGFGLPVLGTRIVGTVEAVIDGETGFLVDPDRIEDLVAATVRIARDPALRARLGAAGAAYVRAHFARERNAEEISRLYAELGG